jgi:hypothetical protein
MKTKNNLKFKKGILFLVLMSLILIPLVSAGVGIKWGQESSLVKEGKKTCLTYEVYNPWPEETWVTIEAQGNILDIITSKQAETKLIPANTPSTNAIPLEFCFVVPNIYPQDCWIADKLMCKKDYNGEFKLYSGEILVKSVPAPANSGGSGGSTTAMAVSAPLKIRVDPNNHSRDFSLLYIIIAIISLIVVVFILKKKYSRSQLDKDKDQLKKLKEKIKKDKKKKK